MDFDKQIREEVKLHSPEYRAFIELEKALRHGDPVLTEEAVFDTTTFGERDSEALRAVAYEISDTTEELDGILSLRQRDTNPQVA
jgi:hypothetical protein